MRLGGRKLRATVLRRPRSQKQLRMSRAAAALCCGRVPKPQESPHGTTCEGTPRTATSSTTADGSTTGRQHAAPHSRKLLAPPDTDQTGRAPPAAAGKAMRLSPLLPTAAAGSEEGTAAAAAAAGGRPSPSGEAASPASSSSVFPLVSGRRKVKHSPRKLVACSRGGGGGRGDAAERVAPRRPRGGGRRPGQGGTQRLTQRMRRGGATDHRRRRRTARIARAPCRPMPVGKQPAVGRGGRVAREKAAAVLAAVELAYLEEKAAPSAGPLWTPRAARRACGAASHNGRGPEEGVSGLRRPEKERRRRAQAHAAAMRARRKESVQASGQPQPQRSGGAPGLGRRPPARRRRRWRRLGSGRTP